MSATPHDPPTPAATAEQDRKVQVRRLGPTERDALLAAAPLFDSGIEPEAAEAFLSAPDDHLLLATIDGAPVGYARAYDLRRLEGLDPILVVLQSRVAPSHKRRGVGRALIDALKALGRARHAEQMLIFTDTDEEVPLGLFSGTGGIQRASRRVIYEYDLRGNSPARSDPLG